MKRFAILGSDSTHTEVYAEMARDDMFRSRVRVASIWGADREATRAKAAALGIDRVASTAAEAVEGADAVLVLSRFASDRPALGALAIAAGLPVFIDKSLSEDPVEAEAIVGRARDAGVPLMSCSPYRFAAPIVDAKRRARADGIAHCLMVGPRECNDLGDDPRFARLDFYGMHSAETVVEILGDDLRSIETATGERATAATMTFGGGALCTVALIAGMSGEGYRLTLSGRDGSRDVEFGFDADALYRESLAAIIDQLFEGRERVPASSNVTALRIISAMQAAA